MSSILLPPNAFTKTLLFLTIIPPNYPVNTLRRLFKNPQAKKNKEKIPLQKSAKNERSLYRGIKL